MDQQEVELCFGTTKKWMKCDVSLSPTCDDNLNLIISRSVSSVQKTCSVLTQTIALHNLLGVYSVYHSVQRPHCIEIARHQQQRIFVSFAAATLVHEWKQVLNKHVNVPKTHRALSSSTSLPAMSNKLNTENTNQLKEVQLSLPGTNTFEDRRQLSIGELGGQLPISSNPMPSDSDSEDDGLYESIELYYRPEVPAKLNPPDSPTRLPPPLPVRRKMSDSQRKLHDLYNSANRWLSRVHDIMKQIEEVKDEVVEEEKDATVGLLIDLDEGEELVHFDSIPLPRYPSPAVPHRKMSVGDYMQPVSSIAREPIYAKINKKKVTFDEKASRTSLISSSVHPPPLPAKFLS